MTHTFWAVIALLAMTMASSTWAQSPHIAVDDFQRGPGLTDADDWAVGLADYLEAALSQRGVNLIERRRVRDVLAERRLAALTQRDGDLPRLPGADMLVTGVIDRTTGPTAAEHFTLAAEWLRADGGTRVRSFSLSGRYPDDLPAAIDRLATQIRDAVADVAVVQSPLPDVLPGFTRQPELALLYHRGHEHLAAGRMAPAIACFFAAQRADSNFTLAKVWFMRALERAGLPKLARAVHQSLRADDTHADAVTLLLADEPGLRSRLLVASIDALPEANLDIAAVLDELDRHERIDVLSTQWLWRVVREHDLKLSGQIAASMDAPTQWLVADAVPGLRRDADGQLQLTLRDTVTGRPLAAAAIRGGPRAVALDLIASLDRRDQLGQAASLFVDRMSSARPTQLPIGAKTIDAPRWGVRISGSTRAGSYQDFTLAQLTQAVQFVLDDPGNLTHLTELSDMMWRPIAVAVDDHIIATVRGQPELPYGPEWLSEALYSRFEGEFHGSTEPDEVKFSRELPLAQRYELLLQLYPDSAATFLIRYGMAHEMLIDGRREEGLAQLIAFADELPSRRFVDDQQPPKSLQWSLLFFIARESFAQGRIDQARQYLRKLDETDITPNSYVSPDYEATMSLSTRPVAWTIGGRNKLSHRHYYEHKLHYRQDLQPEIRALRRRIELVQHGLLQPGPYDSAERLFQRAVAATGREAWDLHLASMREHLIERNPDRSVPQRVRLQLAWLCAHAVEDADRAAVEQITDALLADLKTIDQHYTLAMIGGRYDDAQAWIDKAAGHPTPKQPTPNWYFLQHLRPLVRQIEIDSIWLPPDEQAKNLINTIGDVQRQRAALRPEPTLALCVITEILTPQLIVLGRSHDVRRWLNECLQCPELPTLYRQRLLIALARVMSMEGESFEATELLRKVLAALDAHVAGPDDWRADGPDTTLTHDAQRMGSNTAKALADDARKMLEDVRHYGGYEHLFLTGATPAHPTLDDRQLQRLYALAYLQNVRSDRYDTWEGVTYWREQALELLKNVGPDGRPLLLRLLSVRCLSDMELSLQADHQRGAIYGLNTLAIQSPPTLPELMPHLRWFHDTNERYYTLSRLSQMGPDAADALPAMVLITGVDCRGCAPRAAENVTALAFTPTHVRGQLQRMLEHPNEAVRQHAAAALAKPATPPPPALPEP